MRKKTILLCLSIWFWQMVWKHQRANTKKTLDITVSKLMLLWAVLVPALICTVEVWTICSRHLKAVERYLWACPKLQLKNKYTNVLCLAGTACPREMYNSPYWLLGILELSLSTLNPLIGRIWKPEKVVEEMHHLLYNLHAQSSTSCFTYGRVCSFQSRDCWFLDEGEGRGRDGN